jgi:hypothetical protein
MPFEHVSEQQSDAKVHGCPSRLHVALHGAVVGQHVFITQRCEQQSESVWHSVSSGRHGGHGSDCPQHSLATHCDEQHSLGVLHTMPSLPHAGAASCGASTTAASMIDWCVDRFPRSVRPPQLAAMTVAQSAAPPRRIV